MRQILFKRALNFNWILCAWCLVAVYLVALTLHICDGILFFHFINCCKWSSCLFGDLKLEIVVVDHYERRRVDSFLLEIGRKYLSKDISA